jgi:hypothetical protein
LPFRKSLAILLATQLTFVAAQVQAQAPAAQPQAPAAQPQVPDAQPQAPPAPAQPQNQPQTPAAQVQPPAQLAPLPTVEDLKVLVLEGQRSINNTTRHIGIQPVVEVRDVNDRPVEGATVVFRLPPSGPGGTFAGNSLTFSAGSNAQGQAAATGFVPNDQQGRFDIHVTAAYQNRTGEATISQTNSPNNLSLLAPTVSKRPLWRNKWVLIGAGAGIVTLVLVLTLGHSGPKAVTIIPGAVTINQ